MGMESDLSDKILVGTKNKVIGSLRERNETLLGRLEATHAEIVSYKAQIKALEPEHHYMTKHGAALQEAVTDQAAEIKRLEAEVARQIEKGAGYIADGDKDADDVRRDTLTKVLELVDENGDCHGEGDGCTTCRIRDAIKTFAR